MKERDRRIVKIKIDVQTNLCGNYPIWITWCNDCGNLLITGKIESHRPQYLWGDEPDLCIHCRNAAYAAIEKKAQLEVPAQGEKKDV